MNVSGVSIKYLAKGGMQIKSKIPNAAVSYFFPKGKGAVIQPKLSRIMNTFEKYVRNALGAGELRAGQSTVLKNGNKITVSGENKNIFVTLAKPNGSPVVSYSKTPFETQLSTNGLTAISQRGALTLGFKNAPNQKIFGAAKPFGTNVAANNNNTLWAA